MAGPLPEGHSGDEDGWCVPPRYQVKELIGHGAYGEVCEAFDGVAQRPVAIKKTRPRSVGSKAILREVSILSEVRHENIVRMYDLHSPNMLTFDDLYIVMELCDTDMRELCATDCTLPAPDISALLYRLLVGLRYLHSAGIYHRDLKPANVLLNFDLAVKIADFGLARAIGADMARGCGHSRRLSGTGPSEDPLPCEKPTRRLTEHVATRWYRGPELIIKHTYTEAIDTWSAGCIYAELLGLLDTAPADRRPLFPGGSCFPLSPTPGTAEKKRGGSKPESIHLHRTDQLNVIFNVLGTPSEDDIEELEREQQRRYIRRFRVRAGAGLGSRFPRVEPASVDILERMLRFSPSRRITVAGSLEHRLFAGMREPHKEVIAPSVVKLEFETKEPTWDDAHLLKYFEKEIQKFQTCGGQGFKP